MLAKINLARTEMNRINSEGYDYNLPIVDSLVQGWGGANDQNSNTVVMTLVNVMGLKPLALNFVSANNLHVPGYDATLEHSLFERTTESLYQGLKDAGHKVSELWSSAKSFVGNAYEGVQDFFFGLFAREGKVIVGPLQQIDNSLLNLTINTSENSNNASADPNTFVNGTVKSGGDYSIDMPSEVLNEDGLNNQEASKVTSDQIRPGAQTLTQNDTSSWLDKTANFLQQNNIVKPIADLGSSVWSGIQTVVLVCKVQLFIFLLLTSCVGIGFFHESKLERNAFPLEYKCSEINSDPCFPAHIRKEYLLKKFEKPERIEKIGNNQEKLVYKNGLGWSGFNIMIGIPIPVGIPTYRKYKYFYLRDDVVFRIGENYSELFGVWCGFNGGILNDKTHKVEWFGCVTKLK